MKSWSSYIKLLCAGCSVNWGCGDRLLRSFLIEVHLIWTVAFTMYIYIYLCGCRSRTAHCDLSSKGFVRLIYFHRAFNHLQLTRHCIVISTSSDIQKCLSLCSPVVCCADILGSGYLLPFSTCYQLYVWLLHRLHQEFSSLRSSMWLLWILKEMEVCRVCKRLFWFLYCVTGPSLVVGGILPLHSLQNRLKVCPCAHMALASWRRLSDNVA